LSTLGFIYNKSLMTISHDTVFHVNQFSNGNGDNSDPAWSFNISGVNMLTYGHVFLVYKLLNSVGAPQLSASPPKWCKLCWLRGCVVHLMEEPTYIQAACRFTHIDLSWRIKKSASSVTNTCVRKVYKCFYVINAKYISILYNGVFFSTK